MKRVIVTGHLGFIASAFCERFGQTYEISGIDFAGWGSMLENLMPGVRDFRADIADRDAVDRIVEQTRPDAIVNFAAESHVDRSNEDDSCFWRSNVLGARNLALAASKRGIRMVHVSTDEVYGDATSASEPWIESMAFRPKNPYAVTKAAAEMLLAVYAKGRTELDLVLTRGANTVGPRQFPEKAIPKAVWCFTHGVPFPLFRTPARRMWLHVADHVAGIEAALRKGQRGEAYNIAPMADCEAVTETVIERVRDLVGRGDIQKVEDRDHYDLRYWMDASKAKLALGWQAVHGLEDTLSSTVRWYLDHPAWLEAAHAKVSPAGPGG
ncbi:MAG: GDP-mannose 4,6-dehydratase [Polyangiaceae bacterium]|nr:GDP-mannose 4,6-dehydratase [Polyangiaceae bacterium]